MEFDKYSSLSHAIKTRVHNAVINMGFAGPDIPWIVTEKIHGANFGLTYNVLDAAMTPNKRSSFLPMDDTFYGFQTIKKGMVEALQSLYQLVGDNVEESISVRGEIAGGGFYGTKDRHAKSVQSGTNYNTANFFAAFDLIIDGRYIKPIEAHVLLDAAGFNIVPVLGVYKTFAEAMEVSNVFESLVPAMFNCKAEEENFAEGWVARPFVHEFVFGNEKRVILKSVNPKFSENVHVPRVKEPKELPEAAQVLFNATVSYLNENRLNAVISKHGAPQQKEFGLIMGMLVQDALDEYSEDVDSTTKELKELMDENWKPFVKAYSSEASKIVRELWIQTF